MIYGRKRNPVLFMVLVFLLLCSACSGEKEIVELTLESAAEQEAGSPAVSGAGEVSQANSGQMKAAAGRTEGNAGRAEEAAGQPEGTAGQADNVPAEGTANQPSGLASNEDAQPPSSVVVHICGAVNEPGVYELPEGSRVCDAVEAAGGLNEEAVESSVNQAALLWDGVQIIIPTQEEAQNGGISETGIIGGREDGQPGTGGMQAGLQAGGGQPEQGLVNINTAGAEELMTLPGIGQTRAEAVLAYRQAYGAFRMIEDIMKVDGIKEGSFAKLKHLITV